MSVGHLSSPLSKFTGNHKIILAWCIFFAPISKKCSCPGTIPRWNNFAVGKDKERLCGFLSWNFKSKQVFKVNVCQYSNLVSAFIKLKPVKKEKSTSEYIVYCCCYWQPQDIAIATTWKHSSKCYSLVLIQTSL